MYYILAVETVVALSIFIGFLLSTNSNIHLTRPMHYIIYKTHLNLYKLLFEKYNNIINY